MRGEAACPCPLAEPQATPPRCAPGARRWMPTHRSQITDVASTSLVARPRREFHGGCRHAGTLTCSSRSWPAAGRAPVGGGGGGGGGCGWWRRSQTREAALTAGAAWLSPCEPRRWHGGTGRVSGSYTRVPHLRSEPLDGRRRRPRARPDASPPHPPPRAPRLGAPARASARACRRVGVSASPTKPSRTVSGWAAERRASFLAIPQCDASRRQIDLSPLSSAISSGSRGSSVVMCLLE